jgi:phosphomannomutase
VLSFVDVEAIKPLQVVIDAANGMAGAMLPPILERLPINAVRCFFEPDGTFRTTRRTRCCRRTASSSSPRLSRRAPTWASAFDGDADRCFFVDDTGEFVPGDFVTALSGRVAAREGAGGEDHLRPAGELGRAGDHRARRRRTTDQPRRPRVHQAADAEEGAAFGGEVSGHYYFRDFSQADSGVVPFLLMLELVSKENRKLSEILADYRGATS